MKIKLFKTQYDNLYCTEHHARLYNAVIPNKDQYILINRELMLLCLYSDNYKHLCQHKNFVIGDNDLMSCVGDLLSTVSDLLNVFDDRDNFYATKHCEFVNHEPSFALFPKECLNAEHIEEDNSDIVVFYHKNCFDGLGAKFSAHLYFGDTAQYIPYSYDIESIPELNNKHIYFVDCSVKLSKLKQLLENNRVTVIDHHLSAELDYAGFEHENFELDFDKKHSGAVLTFKHFFDCAVPKILLHIEDRDLWRFDMDRTIYIHYYLLSVENLGIETLKDLIVKGLDEATKLGKGVKNFVDQQIERELKHFSKMYILGEPVPTVNCQKFITSELLNTYLNRNPEVDYVAAYQDIKGARIWSLRSQKHFDCSKIAEQFGGGGHKNAAGFKTTITDNLI